MIDREALTEQDKGRWVEYAPGHGDPEQGRIKSWNDKWIFVVYHCGDRWEEYTKFTAAATPPQDLTFKEVQ